MGEMSEWEQKLRDYAQQHKSTFLLESMQNEWQKVKTEFDLAVLQEEATMTLTLTPEQTRKLKAKAERAHKSMDAVLEEF